MSGWCDIIRLSRPYTSDLLQTKELIMPEASIHVGTGQIGSISVDPLRFDADGGPEFPYLNVQAVYSQQAGQCYRCQERDCRYTAI